MVLDDDLRDVEQQNGPRVLALRGQLGEIGERATEAPHLLVCALALVGSPE